MAVTETGPVYLDQISAGASFRRVSYTEPGLRVGAVPDPVPSVPLPPSALDGLDAMDAMDAMDGGRPAPVGWHADPGAQRGLLESEDAPRWVSWGAPPADRPEPAALPAVIPAPVPVVVPAPVAVVAAALPAVRQEGLPTRSVWGGGWSRGCWTAWCWRWSPSGWECR